MTVVIISFFMLLGCFFVLAAAIGLIRFPDVYCRAHSSGMSPSWGIVNVLISALVFFIATGSGFKPVLLIIVFSLFLTSPVGTNMILKGAYASGIIPPKELVRDDLAEFRGTKKTDPAVEDQ